jgi:hypothetical protein
MTRFLMLLGFLGCATTAYADPCEAPVTGFAPQTRLRGEIRYVGDGDSLCIGRTDNPAEWLEIRLADFFAPELHEPGGPQAKAALARYLGAQAICTVQRGSNGATRSYDRLIASCSVAGVPISRLLVGAGVGQGGRGLR